MPSTDQGPGDAPANHTGRPAGEGTRRDRHSVDLQPDVQRIHSTIRREPRDPLEGRERVPWFLLALIPLTIFWGGWYLGKHGGQFDTTSHLAFATRQTGIAAAAAGQSAAAISDPIAAGKAVYEKNCQVCHQMEGAGMTGAFPPLVGSEWVTGAPEMVVRILLHGLQGPLEVAGHTYNGAMPAWDGVLQDGEIAAVATYIRQLAGNDAGAVAPATVNIVREVDSDRTTPWTVADLEQAPPVDAAGADASAAPSAPDSTTPAGGAP